MPCGVADCDPLESHGVSASFGFLRVLLDAQQQDLHGVDSLLDMRDAVEDSERLPRVFTEQRLRVHKSTKRNSLAKLSDGKMLLMLIQ